MSFAAWPRLWLCADLSHPTGEGVLAHVAHALELAPVTVWLRAPGVSGLRAYGAATVLRSLTHGFGARLVVGDRLDLALACGADGVHLGESSVTPDDARSLARRAGRDDLVVTRSVHDLAAVARWRDSVDALVVSPYGEVPGKGAPLGEAGLRAMRGAAGETPLVALGGIVDALTARSALASGAWAVATRRAVCDGGDVVEAVRALLAALDPATTG